MNVLELAAIVVTLLASDSADPTLEIGDPAPPLAVSRWVKGEPVTKFAQDRTYIVELWATWCAPCRHAMSHLTGLAKAHRDRVTVVGVSVAEADQARVEPFVAKMGDKMGYAVAMDDVAAGDKLGLNGQIIRLWQKAAGERGIPSAFMVHQGKVVWIGHPNELDGPLKKVLTGQWDLASASRARQRLLAANKKYREVILPKLEPTLSAGWPTDKTVAIINQALEDDPSLEWGDAGWYKFQFLLKSDHVAEAMAYGAHLIDTVCKDHPFALRVIAHLIVDYMPPKNGAKPDLKLALKAAQRACDLTHNADPRALDVLARVHFAMGDPAQALETEQKAVALQGDDTDHELQERLEEYRKTAHQRSRKPLSKKGPGAVSFRH